MKKFFVLVLLFSLDYFSKLIIFKTISLNKFIEIFPILDLAHIHNYGISFGLFANSISSWIIIIIGIAIVAVIFYMMMDSSNIIEKWGYLLIIIGAISNIFDRIVNGYVVDFIYLHYKNFYWPAFNFADIYITFGVLMILLNFLIKFKKTYKKEN